MGYERSGRYYGDSGDRHFSARERDNHVRDRDDWRDSEFRGRERGYGRPSHHDDDRGFFERAGDELRSWFGDEEAERRRRWDERLRDREDERQGERERYRGARAGSYGYGRSPDFSTHSDWGAGRGAGATMNYGLGASPDHDGWGDSNYRAWRQRQIEALDRDYHEYRRENEDRFHSDFGSWRSHRMGQRESLGRVQEHAEVVGSDGSHIGTVDHVRGDRIILTKSDKDAGGRHHSIPCSWITEVADKVKVSRTAAQAQQAWKDEERSEGPHYLNRAFSGTY
jgi:hypothetical protein